MTDLREESAQPPIITFREGLLGFADAQRFTLLRTDDPSLFWLQSLEHEPLAFLLLDPFAFFDDYSVELDDTDIEAIGAAKPSEIAVLAIVTLPSGPDEPSTANLLGPIAINLKEGIARQVILRDSEYSVRAAVDLE